MLLRFHRCSDASTHNQGHEYEAIPRTMHDLHSMGHRCVVWLRGDCFKLTIFLIPYDIRNHSNRQKLCTVKVFTENAPLECLRTGAMPAQPQAVSVHGTQCGDQKGQKHLHQGTEHWLKGVIRLRLKLEVLASYFKD